MLSSIARQAVLFILLIYKRMISPWMIPCCRYQPTCSEYAMEAFQKKGLFEALRLTVVRIANCHPFHPGGSDPVDPVRKPGSEAGADGELTLSSSDCNIHARPH